MYCLLYLYLQITISITIIYNYCPLKRSIHVGFFYLSIFYCLNNDKNIRHKIVNLVLSFLCILWTRWKYTHRGDSTRSIYCHRVDKDRYWPMLKRYVNCFIIINWYSEVSDRKLSGLVVIKLSTTNFIKSEYCIYNTRYNILIELFQMISVAIICDNSLSTWIKPCHVWLILNAIKGMSVKIETHPSWPFLPLLSWCCCVYYRYSNCFSFLNSMLIYLNSMLIHERYQPPTLCWDQLAVVWW